MRVGVCSGQRNFTLNSRLVVEPDGTEIDRRQKFRARADRSSLHCDFPARLRRGGVGGAGRGGYLLRRRPVSGYGWMFPMA